MKKIFYIFVAALALTATACKSEKDIDLDMNGGDGLVFVHFENASDAWLVTADDESYDYSLLVGVTKAPAADVTYNITLGDKTTGVEGTDFSIPTKSVTIKAGDYTSELPVKVLYETTGEGFEIELVLSVEESLINPVYGATALISVKSDKITIDWEWLVGTWNEQDISGDPYPMSISQKDETTAIFTNIWAMESDIEGTVDFDARTVTFHGPQNLGPAYNGSLMMAHLGASGYDEGDIVATLSPLGIVIAEIGFYLDGGDYDGYDFGEDYITLTR
jgi:hypothetical protein